MKFDIRQQTGNSVKELLMESLSRMNVKVKDFMKTNPTLLDTNAKLKDAIEVFIQDRVDGVPIVNEDKAIIGIVTKTLALREIYKSGNTNIPITKVMKANPIIAEPNEDCLHVIGYNIGSLPIVDNNEVVGVIYLDDTIRACLSSVLQLREDVKTVIDSSSSGIISVDTNLQVLLINAAAERILGTTSAEILDKPIINILPDSKLRHVIKTGVTETGLKLFINNKVIVLNISPLRFDDEIHGAVALFQDISDLDSISEELKYTKELKGEMDTILESSYDGIYLTDNIGKILRVNEAMTRITGIKKEEIINKTLNELVEQGVFNTFVPLQDLRKGAPITFSQEVKTGKSVLVTSTPIADNMNNISRIVHNVRDMTELNSLKNQLEKAEGVTQHYRDQLKMMKISNKYIAKSQKSKELVKLVLKLSKIDVTVLLLGESGVGKDVIAEMLHDNSPRQEKLMLTINCAAIPETLLESELFGYESGAFTGANRKGKLGAFEIANGGTLFLDEIGEMPLSLQSKLLRVIQKKEISKLGSNIPFKIDVRIIAATNRDLWQMVINNTFRRDLYYRLNVMPVTIPPLRERKEEISELVNHFTKLFNKKYSFNKRFDERAIYKMLNYDWPGNIRELENVVERSIITSQKDVILNVEFLNDYSNEHRNDASLGSFKFKPAIESFEREMIINALQKFGTTRKAAAELGMSQPTFVRKAMKYKINSDAVKET